MAAAGGHRGLERVGDKAGAHVLSDRPANHPPAEQIDDGSQIQPTLTGAQVGDVTAPRHIGGDRVEVPTHTILRCFRGAVDDGGANLAPPRLALEALLAHDARDALA
jgi:hypothetical protein